MTTEELINELMKLPRTMLLGMCREAEIKPPEGCGWDPGAWSLHSLPCASAQEAAQALAIWMLKKEMFLFYIGKICQHCGEDLTKQGSYQHKVTTNPQSCDIVCIHEPREEVNHSLR